MKHSNILTVEIPEEESEQGIENLSEEIITENFSSLVKEEVTQDLTQHGSGVEGNSQWRI